VFGFEGELKEQMTSSLKLPDRSDLDSANSLCTTRNELWVAGGYEGLLKYDIT